MIWRTERSNHVSVIVSSIELLLIVFLEGAFKTHLAQKSEGARAPLVWMGMMPLNNMMQKQQIFPILHLKKKIIIYF